MTSYEKGRYLGRAAEHRVMAELLLRGINFYSCDLDSGVDLMLENGLKIQIKGATRRRTSTRGYDYYVYILNTNKKAYPNSKYARKANLKETVDFVIGWCVDDDLFYILPVNEISDTNINLSQVNGKGKYEKFRNAWLLLEGED